MHIARQAWRKSRYPSILSIGLVAIIACLLAGFVHEPTDRTYGIRCDHGWGTGDPSLAFFPKRPPEAVAPDRARQVPAATFLRAPAGALAGRAHLCLHRRQPPCHRFAKSPRS